MADDDLEVQRGFAIPRSELTYRFSASGGPGGQHANKAATRVELTWDAEATTAIGGVRQARIVEKLGPVVRIVVDDERSQTRNRALADQRLVVRLQAALHVEPPRRATKPSRGAKERRLQEKKQRSQTKADRRRPPTD